MEADIIITVALVTGVVLVFNHVSRLLRARMTHKTIREAISRDNANIGPLLDKIEEPQTAGSGDDRNGLVLIALAAAIFCFGLINGDPDNIRALSGIALFPTFVGAALLGRFWYMKRSGAGR